MKEGRKIDAIFSRHEKRRQSVKPTRRRDLEKLKIKLNYRVQKVLRLLMEAYYSLHVPVVRFLLRSEAVHIV
jgi:hypothetical protein